MDVEEVLTFWFEVLFNHKDVRVFERNDEVVWTDRVGYARVPPPLVPMVEVGKIHHITPTGIDIGPRFTYGNMMEMLDAIEKKNRTIAEDTGNSREMNIKEGLVTAREYRARSKGDIIPINNKLHGILLSASRRGASLYTDAKRHTLAAKIDGEMVALVAAIKVTK